MSCRIYHNCYIFNHMDSNNKKQSIYAPRIAIFNSSHYLSVHCTCYWPQNYHAIGNLWEILWRFIIRLILLFHYRCFSGQCIVKFTGRCMALRYAHFTFMHFVTQCHTNYQRLCSAYGSINCLISWKFAWIQSEIKCYIWKEMIKGSSNELLKVITIRRFSLSIKWTWLDHFFMEFKQKVVYVVCIQKNNTLVIFLIFFLNFQCFIHESIKV